MAQSATGRMTLGAIFGTVGTAAGAVSSTLDTIVGGVSMLDSYVKDASIRQQKRSTIEMSEFADQLLDEAAQLQALRRTQADAFCAQSVTHKTYYDEAHAKLTAVLNTSK